MSNADTSTPADTSGAPAEGGTATDTQVTGGAPADQSSEAGQGAAAADGQGAGNETPPAGGASPEGEGATEGAGKEAPAGAPEQYSAFNVPEGYELDGAMLEGVTTFAKAHNLNQEQAQALVDLGLKQADAIAERFVSEAQQAPVPMSQHWAQQWSKQTTEDPDLGGAKLEQTMALSHRVFQTFGSPELATFLNETGFAHHPELIRFMHKVGQAVSEDTLVTPTGGSHTTPVGRDPAKKLYPGMN